jgi:CelD/BcsL family acetyltransferase involved in cellulose biosynthesis
MNIELVTRREDFAGLAARWDELALCDPRDGFCRTSGWYWAWIEHIRPDAEPFIIVVRNDGGEIVGLAPLCRGVYRDMGFRLTGIFWAGREVVSGDFLDFLSVPEVRPQVIAGVLEFLEQNRSRWSLLIMGELVDGADSYAAIERMGKQHGLPLRRQEERICPYIALPATFDEYLGSLGSSTRYHIRRRMRDMEKKGGQVQRYDDPQEIASRLDIMIRLHLARWHKENLPGTMNRPGFPAFLRDICAHPPTGSQCRLYLLTHEGAPVAALMAFYFGQSALYYQAGWEPDSALAPLSPAVVLMAHSIRDAIQHGLRYYEFLRGDEAYKSRWTKTTRKTATLLLGQSFTAKQFLHTARMKDLLKRSFGPKMQPSPEGEAAGEGAATGQVENHASL